MRQPAKFEYRDEFADFLPENGVPISGQMSAYGVRDDY